MEKWNSPQGGQVHYTDDVMAASNDGGWFSALQFKYISSCSNELLEIENGTTVLKHKFIAKYDNSDNTVLSAISLL